MPGDDATRGADRTVGGDVAQHPARASSPSQRSLRSNEAEGVGKIGYR